jgi:nucleotidyltransferase substrate binding protein (TIGR01987 family)
MGIGETAALPRASLLALCYPRRITQIDLSPLADALRQLEVGLAQVETDALPDELLRDGVIQRFEVSHDLALRLLKRTLEVVFDESVDTMGYNDVLRTAFEHGLIGDVQKWIAYREARNQTSHTYDAATAAEVFSVARPFLADGRELLSRLSDANRSAST